MFGISTHLYVGDRLDRDHLVEIAAHGFEAVEVFARPRPLRLSRSPRRDRAGRMARRHAPAACTRCTRRSPARYVNGDWQDGLSLASADEGRRKAAVDETLAALDVAAAVPYKVLVVHCGVPVPVRRRPATITAARWCAASKSCRRSPNSIGVRLAVEVIPNELSTPSALVELIESDIDAAGLGICMDVGHARHDGRRRRRDRDLLGPRDHDAPARQSRPQRRSPRARQGRDRLGCGAAGVPEGGLRRRSGSSSSRSPRIARPILEQAAKARERFESLLHIGDEMMGLDET